MKAIEPWHCWFRMFETAGISLDTLRPFGQGAGRRGKKKKGKEDVCCIEVWRGGQHMACTAFPDM